MRCKVYFPKGYGSNKKYPVWYGLNGHGSNENMWMNAGLTESVDELIDSGDIKPLILVFPYTINTSIKELSDDFADDGKLSERNMDRFVCEEVVPYIDSHFDTINNRNGRFIGGFSMGGMIALRIGFHHTDMFSKAAGYSPAVAYSDFSGTQLEEWLFPNIDMSKIRNIEKFDRKKKLNKLTIYIDAGNSNDPFFTGVQSFHKALEKRGISSVYRPYDGGHSLNHNNGDYGNYMRFFAGP